MPKSKNSADHKKRLNAFKARTIEKKNIAKKVREKVYKEQFDKLKNKENSDGTEAKLID